jgi:hypothetical protein
MVEMAISASLLAFILGATLMISLSSAGAFSMGASNAQLESRLRTAAKRIVQEFVPVGRATLVPDPQPIPNVQGVGTATLDYRKVVGVAGGVPQWGQINRIAFEYSPSELDNGLDDDGNGLVDEGTCVMTENPDTAQARRVVLVNGVRELLEGELSNGVDDNANGLVDEPGLVFDVNNDNLIIRLSVERMPSDGSQRRIVRTIETSILLRN